MKKISLSVVLFTSILAAQELPMSQISIPSSFSSGSVVVPNDEEYFTYEDDKKSYELIYTKENTPYAKHTVAVEDALQKDYERLFNWKLDETMYVGLISKCNQIANGFSTQWPNNMQMNYIGGAQKIDYFSVKSWIDLLLQHETAHNYQVNVKESPISQGLHTVFGNGSIYTQLIPLIVPNAVENPFMLEGNAVLNESWHGNGGRLYNGALYAQALLAAKAGKITPQNMYNLSLDFPYYGFDWYLIGGHYNYYLAKKYSFEKVHTYFKRHSEDFWWPQFTNASMEDTLGVDFETSLKNFADEYAKRAGHMQLASGKQIATSQMFYSLGNDANEVFFLVNERGVESPMLVAYNKKNGIIEYKKGSWRADRVIKAGEKYYTQTSMNVSPTKKYMGLFDEDGFIKEGSESKVVQGYLSDGRAVYFDVATSFNEPQLYIGNKFYARVNSSVYIDKNDNLYYFTQESDKTRTLYKNKTPLYSFKSFYGNISGVDSKGGVYFVSNSEFGSTLYRYENGKITRGSEADNIVEARIIDDSTVLLGAVNDKEFYYVVSPLKSIDTKQYDRKLFFESAPFYGPYKADLSQQQNKRVEEAKPYNEMLELHYSGTDALYFETGVGSFIIINAKFADPLGQNTASVFVQKDDLGVWLSGVQYENSKNFISYKLAGYAVLDKNKIPYREDYGFMGLASVPFYRAGYYSGSVDLSYYQDYSNLREPFGMSVNFGRYENYGFSMFYNYMNSISLYAAVDRADKIAGVKYGFEHDLIDEFYIGLHTKYSQTDASLSILDALIDTRGVKITNNSVQADYDPSAVTIPSMSGSTYVQKAGYGDVSLSKVLNFSSYWFTFPVSLQREALYAKYRYYGVKDYFVGEKHFSEYTLGGVFGTIFLNKYLIPLSVEYIKNDANTYYIKEKERFRFGINVSF